MNRRALLVAAARPNWSWNFAARQAVPPGALFSRASTGTYFDGAGVQRSAGANVARFDRDPVTGAPLGYLAEMQSTNAVFYSKALTVSPWAPSGLTVTDNTVASPDGTTNASTLIETAVNSTHELDFNGIGYTSGSVYGFAASVKNIAGNRWVILNVSGTGYCYFNPATGAIGTVGTYMSNAVARQMANGWWRFSVLYTAPITSGSTSVRFYLATSNNTGNAPGYTGDGASGIALTDVQFETPGVGVTSVIPTVGAAVTRAQDVLAMPLTALPGWNPSRGGVLVGTYRINTVIGPTLAAQPLVGVSGTASNYIMSYPYSGYFSGLRMGILARADPGSQLSGAAGVTVTPFMRRRQAMGWSLMRLQIAHDGVLDLASAGLVPAPAVTSLLIGCDAAGMGATNGSIESLAYYAGARSDAFVQQVSR